MTTPCRSVPAALYPQRIICIRPPDVCRHGLEDEPQLCALARLNGNCHESDRCRGNVKPLMVTVVKERQPAGITRSERDRRRYRKLHPENRWNGDKTHCPQGHSYEEHGRRKPNGARYCLICQCEAQRRRRQRAKERKAG